MVSKSEIMSVLVVDDEPDLREMVVGYLKGEGILTREAADAASAWQEIITDRPDIILLDWMLPDMDGIQLLYKIRSKKRLRRVAVIMLTARADEQSRVAGLDAGADDYIVKPFSLQEMVARLRAVSRRIQPPLDAPEMEPLPTDEISMDINRHKVFVKGERAHLSPTEFRLLHFLMSHPDKVYSRSQLLSHVWGDTVVVEERTVDQHVRRLRKVLEQHGGSGQVIATVRGFGYQFTAHDAVDDSVDGQ